MSCSKNILSTKLAVNLAIQVGSIILMSIIHQVTYRTMKTVALQSCHRKLVERGYDLVDVGIFILRLRKPSPLIFLRIRQHTPYSIALIVSGCIDTTKTIVIIAQACEMINGWHRHFIVEFQFIGLLILPNRHGST